MTNEIKHPVEVDETALEDAQGGIGMLLPAVQKVRDAAAKSAAGDVNGDGRDDIIVGAGTGGGPHVRAFDGRIAGKL